LARQPWDQRAYSHAGKDRRGVAHSCSWIDQVGLVPVAGIIGRFGCGRL